MVGFHLQVAKLGIQAAHKKLGLAREVHSAAIGWLLWQVDSPTQKIP